MNHDGSHGEVRNVRVWGADGTCTEPTDVRWAHGSVLDGANMVSRAEPLDGPEKLDVSETVDAAETIDGTGLWLIPGLVDAHVHAGWQAFNASDHDELSETRTTTLVAAGLRRTLAAGFTSVRDGGGLTPAQVAAVPSQERPRVQTAIALIDRPHADAAGGIERAVAMVLERGAQWVKLVATAGVTSPAGVGLEAHFSADEMRLATVLAAQAGAAVMVHAWGGTAIDNAIEAGAASIEHGIFLTNQQAHRAAAAGLTFVPTLRIYTLVQAMISRGELPQAFAKRVDEAVQAHPYAVRFARDAGLEIALGTDYGTPDQHGTGWLEFEALVAAGLTPSEALASATRGGARLLARVDPDQDAATAGRITPGAPADAVLLRRDPRTPGACADPAAVVAVISRGRLVADSLFERNAL